MNNMEINKQKLYEKYMAKVNEISEKCEDKSHFTPKEIVDIISDLLEKDEGLFKKES